MRAAFGAHCEQMPFHAKLIVVFNEHNMPKIDVEDHAFLKRMLLIEHRSHFCNTPAEMAKMRDEPHTFMADSEVKSRVNRNAVLAWMLAGLDMFNAEGASAVLTLPTPHCAHSSLCSLCS